MNGNDVRVWVDKWLPSIPSGKHSVLGTVQVSQSLLVKSLICLDNGEWDIDFLKPFMAEAEFEAILEMHIGDPTLRDRLVWPYEKRGTYLVKSGYHWALTRNQSQRSLNSHTSATILGALWKIVWNLEVPPKLKCFIWKTLHATIPTMANLYQRRSSPSPLCPYL